MADNAYPESPFVLLRPGPLDNKPYNCNELLEAFRNLEINLNTILRDWGLRPMDHNSFPRLTQAVVRNI
jgi:hypothetical protein